MKEIELTQGRVALVDDEDFEELNRFKWFAHRWRHGWYAKRNLQRVEGKRPFLSMHCQIMGKISGLEMDHRDGNGLNNQKDNLRFATRSQNMANRKPSPKSSKYKGVSWDTNKKKWVSCLRKNKISRHLGYFLNEINAALAYDEAARKYHGEFAKTNF